MWVALLAVGICCLLLVVLVGTVTTTDAPLDPYNHGEQGTSRLVEAADGSVVVSYTALNREPTPETAIILAGGSAVNTADVTALRGYLDDGGTVIFLTEDERSNRLFAALGLASRVGDGYLRTTANQSQSGTPAQFSVIGSGTASLRFTAVQVNAAKPLGVAANRDNTSRTVLAWTPRAGRDLNADGRIDAAEPRGSYPVAVSESVGAGRVILVGDASVLTNGQWQVRQTRRLAGTLTTDDALVVYPQTARFAPISRLRLALKTPLGTGLGIPLFCGVGAIGVWLCVVLYQRVKSPQSTDQTLHITWK